MRASFDTASFAPDNLLAGNADKLVGRNVIIAAGQVLPRGAVVGKITASDEYTLSLATTDDGSELPVGVLAENVDTTTGVKPAIVYSRGVFTTTALTVGTGHSLETITDPLRAGGIDITESLI